MLFEVISYYTRGFGYSSNIDKECSTPPREISEQDASEYMAILVRLGAKRHETPHQVFYETIADSNHSTEYIFYKE